MDREAQWLFLSVLSQPEVNAAGMLPLRLRRWASLAGDAADLERAMAALVVNGWLEVDQDTQEAYLPTFFASARSRGALSLRSTRSASATPTGCGRARLST